MKSLTRRTFLKNSIVASATLGWSARSWSQVAGANEDIRVAVIGIRSRGESHINAFKKMKGVRLVALCDADSSILEAHANKLREDSLSIETYGDIRRLLDNKNIDAISTATPNHWHALASIWAVQAG